MSEIVNVRFEIDMERVAYTDYRANLHTQLRGILNQLRAELPEEADAIAEEADA